MLKNGFEVSLTVAFALQDLGVVGRQEAEEEVEVGLPCGVAEHRLIDVDIVFNERELITRHRIIMLPIVGQWLGQAESYLALFQDIEEQRPVLTLADGRHIELVAQALDVVDGRQTAYLVVALQHAKRQVLRRDVDARHLVVLVADEVRRTAECTVLARHVGNLLLELLRHPAVVTVAEGDIASLGPLNGTVSGDGRSAVLLEVSHFDASILLREVLQYLSRLVVRAVVGDEQFQVLVGLAQDALYAVGKILAGVKGRHDD